MEISLLLPGGHSLSGLQLRAGGTMQSDNGRKEMSLWMIVALAIAIGWAIAEVILYFFNR
jgi:hypothetical protein